MLPAADLCMGAGSRHPEATMIQLDLIGTRYAWDVVAVVLATDGELAIQPLHALQELSSEHVSVLWLFGAACLAG